MPAPRTLFPRLAVFAAAATAASLFFIDFCNLVFQCGCRSLWAGAADHCNIHMAGAPHCPWCSSAVLGDTAFAAILVAQAVVAFWPGSWSWMMRLLAAIAAFPIVGAVAAVISGWMSGYWR